MGKKFLPSASAVFLLILLGLMIFWNEPEEEIEKRNPFEKFDPIEYSKLCLYLKGYDKYIPFGSLGNDKWISSPVISTDIQFEGYFVRSDTVGFKFRYYAGDSIRDLFIEKEMKGTGRSREEIEIQSSHHGYSWQPGTVSFIFPDKNPNRVLNGDECNGFPCSLLTLKDLQSMKIWYPETKEEVSIEPDSFLAFFLMDTKYKGYFFRLSDYKETIKKIGMPGEPKPNPWIFERVKKIRAGEIP